MIRVIITTKGDFIYQVFIKVDSIVDFAIDSITALRYFMV